MKVILLKSVPKLGLANEVVEVPDGYAANALFPKKLAVQATPARILAIKSRLANKETRTQIQHDLLDRAIGELEGKSLVYRAPANDKGNLFSKVVPSDISKALLQELRISIDPKCLTIREGVLKHVGVYTVDVSDGPYKASFALKIVAK